MPLARKIVSVAGVTELVMLRREAPGWMPLAARTLPLHSIAAADAWLAVPAGSAGFPAGAKVSAFLLRDWGAP